MNYSKEEKENNMIEFDLSKVNVPTGANVTFSMIHPSLASSNSQSFKQRQNSSYFLTVTSPENKIMYTPEELAKQEKLIKNKISQIHSNTQIDSSPPQNDSYFNNSNECVLYSNESPEKKINKAEIEKIDLTENFNSSNTENRMLLEHNKNEISESESILNKLNNLSPTVEVIDKNQHDLNFSLNSSKKVIKKNSNKKSQNFTLNMTIKITGYVIKNIIFQHIKYILTIKKFDNKQLVKLFHLQNLSLESGSFKIYRRYSQFKKLRDMLMNKYIGIFLPSLPRKQIFGSTDINLIEFRKKFLQIFLHELQLCYFFNECDEIKSFLDPTIDSFPPENLKIINEMNNLNEEILFDGICDNLRKTYRINLEAFDKDQKNSIISEKKHFHAENSENVKKENIPVYKTIDLSVIPEKLKKLSEFSKKLNTQKNFLEDIRMCLDHFIQPQKETSKVPTTFLEGLIEFEKYCIFPMVFTENKGKNIMDITPKNEGRNQTAEISDNLKKPNEVKEKSNKINKILTQISRDPTTIKEILNPKGKKSFCSILKNLHDWIYKEVIDSDSIMECIGNMRHCLNRLSEVEEEINKFERNINEKNKSIFNNIEDHSPHSEHGHMTEYANFDLKEKLESKKEKLKEIIALATLNLHNFEIEKFKNMKFQYYYNSLIFLIKENNYNRENGYKIFLSLIDGIIQNVKSLKNIKK